MRLTLRPDEKLSQRKAELKEMRPSGGGKQRLLFHAPSRGLIGYHGEFLTDTRGIVQDVNEAFLQVTLETDLPPEDFLPPIRERMAALPDAEVTAAVLSPDGSRIAYRLENELLIR